MSDETLLNTIRVASTKLDVDNDDHWTADGLPGLEAIHHFTGNQKIKRGNVTDALPDFNRDAARAKAAEATAEPAAPAAAGEAPVDAPKVFAEGDKVDVNGFVIPQEHTEDELQLTEDELNAKLQDIIDRRTALQSLLEEHRKGLKALDDEETKWIDIKNRRYPPMSFEANIEDHLSRLVPAEAQRVQTAEAVRKALVEAGVLKEGQKLKAE